MLTLSPLSGERTVSAKQRREYPRPSKKHPIDIFVKGFGSQFLPISERKKQQKVSQ